MSSGVPFSRAIQDVTVAVTVVESDASDEDNVDDDDDDSDEDDEDEDDDDDVRSEIMSLNPAIISCFISNSVFFTLKIASSTTSIFILLAISESCTRIPPGSSLVAKTRSCAWIAASEAQITVASTT